MMRNLRSLALWMGLSLTLMACGEKKHNVAVDRAAVREVTGGAIVPTENGDLQPMTGLTGRVYATLSPQEYLDPSWQEDFMEAIRGFVSATDNPHAYGYVSGSPNSTSDTGIYFRGHLPLAGQQVSVSESYFLMEIRDQYTGTKAPNGQIIPAYPVRMPLLDYSNVPSDLQHPLTFVFADDYGRVTLHGKQRGSYIEGYMRYQNRYRFDGSAPESGVLGSFRIPMCDFFAGLSGC